MSRGPDLDSGSGAGNQGLLSRDRFRRAINQRRTAVLDALDLFVDRRDACRRRVQADVDREAAGFTRPQFRHASRLPFEPPRVREPRAGFEAANSARRRCMRRMRHDTSFGLAAGVFEW
jgi:hypothetical protein